MTTLEKKNKILAAIASRGWFAGGIYLAEANELYAEGVIKSVTRRTSVGGTKTVWVAA